VYERSPRRSSLAAMAIKECESMQELHGHEILKLKRINTFLCLSIDDWNTD
jgi:hypothetical protein